MIDRDLFKKQIGRVIVTAYKNQQAFSQYSWLQDSEKNMSKDYYREWSYQDRQDAFRDGDREGCRRYDEDRDSGDRAYENWRNGGDFQDPEPDNRFS